MDKITCPFLWYASTIWSFWVGEVRAKTTWTRFLWNRDYYYTHSLPLSLSNPLPPSVTLSLADPQPPPDSLSQSNRWTHRSISLAARRAPQSPQFSSAWNRVEIIFYTLSLNIPLSSSLPSHHSLFLLLCLHIPSLLPSSYSPSFLPHHLSLLSPLFLPTSIPSFL